ncbi:hypothetical protein ColTof4_05572 [Colletotrichum tofieldiae]|nr:hypothetical protein ColTof3_00733 [Colletotrichum tofieldiae]GKT73149.1 hypothetical protein ColTof4_05572 [Colletotrichum tofieldiae]GKT88178.1 hypothetical protein Ct61P_06028 [Colletotrichum tofieldiae]
MVAAVGRFGVSPGVDSYADREQPKRSRKSLMQPSMTGLVAAPAPAGRSEPSRSWYTAMA